MNITRIDLNLLATFDAVATAGSVSGAAIQLNLSQPAVSHALNRLRRVTGDRLFVRSGHALVPTPLALSMQPQVRGILETARTMLARQDFDPNRDERNFRIAASDYAALTIVPKLLQSLRRDAPNTVFEISPVSGATMEELECGETSFTFWGAKPPKQPFEAEHLYDENFVGIIWNRHPLAQAGVSTLEDYLAYPHASVTFGTGTENPVEKALIELGHQRIVRFTGHSVSGNLAAIRETDLVMALPSRLVGFAETLGFVKFELPFMVASFPYSIVWHRRTSTDPAHAWLRGQLLASVQGKLTQC